MSTPAETAFLDAWRRGVEIAGWQYFGDGHKPGTEGTEGSKYDLTKWDLAPRHDDIEAALGWLSSGEATFLAALYSFYNARTGGAMLATLGVTAPGEVAARLDGPRRRVIADLLVSYGGW